MTERQITHPPERKPMTKIRISLADRLEATAKRLRPKGETDKAVNTRQPSTQPDPEQWLSDHKKKAHAVGFSDANAGLPVLSPNSGPYVNGYRAGHVHRMKRLHKVI